jgi:hypothetical protein
MKFTQDTTTPTETTSAGNNNNTGTDAVANLPSTFTASRDDELENARPHSRFAVDVPCGIGTPGN